MTDTNRRPVYFLSHGGGPWPWLTGPTRDGFAEPEESLRRLPSELPEQPRAILMVSDSGFSYHNMRLFGAAAAEPCARSYHQQDVLGGATASSFRLGTSLATSSAITDERRAHV